MINHQFRWNDDERDDASDPECRDCEGLYSEHVVIEGITDEDDVIGYSDGLGDIADRYYVNPKDTEW